jgi:XTP/dITP diphosphohydrolase
VTLRLITATANSAKVAEIQAIFGRSLDVELLPRPSDVPDVVEDADSLVENARLKSRALCTATGIAAVADDTGLFVDALGGQPGVHSARFSGPEATSETNRAKLLVELERVGARDPGERTASFRTIAMVSFPDGTDVWAEGVIAGTIVGAERGSNGFGYDALFAPDDATIAPGTTFGELDSQTKNRISHRAKAFVALAELLRALPSS